jgi:predicted nucleotidyltransferase
MELNKYFEGLISNIEPDPSNVKIAKKAHEKLRSILEKDEDIKDAKPDTYLSGSYARDTAIDDIKDVDVILLIDLDHNKTAPDVVVAWLQGILQKHYSKVVKQGRSVGVTTDNDFCLDIVPSVPISHREGPVWIPDRDIKCWVASHPKGQIAFGTSKNSETGGYYKPLVKIMKHWRDRLKNNDAKPKSYILESLVAYTLTNETSSYAKAVVDIFESIYRNLSPYLSSQSVPIINDPGYPSVNVTKRWSFKEFSDFVNAVYEAGTIARSALTSDDESESIKLWRRLFGSQFTEK